VVPLPEPTLSLSPVYANLLIVYTTTLIRYSKSQLADIVHTDNNNQGGATPLRANMAPIRQSRPDSGRCSQGKVLKTSEGESRQFLKRLKGASSHGLITCEFPLRSGAKHLTLSAEQSLFPQSREPRERERRERDNRLRALGPQREFTPDLSSEHGTYRTVTASLAVAFRENFLKLYKVFPLRFAADHEGEDTHNVQPLLKTLKCEAVPRRARIKVHRLLYHSTLGFRVIKKKRRTHTTRRRQQSHRSSASRANPHPNASALPICRASMAHTRQSRSDSGHCFQGKVLQSVESLTSSGHTIRRRQQSHHSSAARGCPTTRRAMPI